MPQVSPPIGPPLRRSHSPRHLSVIRQRAPRIMLLASVSIGYPGSLRAVSCFPAGIHDNQRQTGCQRSGHAKRGRVMTNRHAAGQPAAWAGLLSRRDLLRVGPLALAATVWPGMLRAAEQARAKSVILLWMA